MIGKIYEIVTEMTSERKQRRDKSEYDSRASEWARMYLDKFENDLSNNGPHSGQFENELRKGPIRGGLRVALNRYGLRRGKSLTYIVIVLGIVTYLVCV
jgi:hypothetical protein|tara:strand:+ start:672 stop:968 length:297 start_codon:yes stop_codon:yes gene_type:complete